MDSLTAIIEKLKAEGYEEDLSKDDGILAEPFGIDNYFRLEGDTDPSEEAVIYAVSSTTSGRKGYLVNAYGIYSDPVTDQLLDHLKVNRR